jgi:peptidoglycan/LPS O-acetylase OafA/YrhL
MPAVTSRVASVSQRGFYIPGLDGIRGVAVLLVFFGHAGLGNIVPGSLGATIFFFLSGYLITTLLRREHEKTGTISLRAFFVRRAFRILPPMYITLTLAVVLASVHWLPNSGRAAGIWAAILYVCNYYGLINGAFHLPTGMEVLWSLAIEEHFYLIFPFVYVAFVGRKLANEVQARILFTVCICILMWRILLVYVVHVDLSIPHPWTYIATDCRLDSIVWGCLLAVRHNPWFSDPAPLFNRHKRLFASGGFVLLLLSLIIRDPAYRESLRYTQQGIALYPIFLLCISSPDLLIVRWLEGKILRWIGWISYSVYLIHFTVLSELRTVVPNLFLAGVVSLGLTLGYAVIMRVVIENPLREWRRVRLWEQRQ